MSSLEHTPTLLSPLLLQEMVAGDELDKRAEERITGPLMFLDGQTLHGLLQVGAGMTFQSQLHVSMGLRCQHVHCK